MSADATTILEPPRPRGQLPSYVPPVGLLILVLLPLLLLPLAAVFVFAFRGGLGSFFEALSDPDAQFALRFSLLIAFATAIVNGVLGTFAAYVLSKYRFPGERPLGITVNLPVAIPTVVVGTSLLLLWGPIGLLGRYLEPLGLQPMFTPVGVLLAHLFVTFPYMLGAVKPVADGKTLEAIIANRYEVMANYARHLRAASRIELARLRSEGGEGTSSVAAMRVARRWLHRDDDKIPHHVKPLLVDAVAASDHLGKLVAMREELRQLWTRTNVSVEQLVADLQAWLRKAEESGIAALQDFALKLRMVRA